MSDSDKVGNAITILSITKDQSTAPEQDLRLAAIKILTKHLKDD